MAGWFDKLFARGMPAAPPPAPAAAAVAPAPPPSAAACVAQGNRLLDTGALAEAAARYEEALRLDAGHVDAAVNLGFVRMELGDRAAARSALESVLARQPAHPDALFMLGNLAVADGDAQAGCERFAALLAARPDFAAAHAPFVRALVAVEQHERAAEVAAAGLALNPRDPELLFLQGNLRRVAGDVAGAIAAYRAAVEIVPAMVEARVPLGHLLLESGDLPAAAALFETGLAAKPNNADLCVKLGDGLRGVGRMDAACAAYRMALEHDPRHAAALVNLASAEATRGRHDAARAAALRATEAAPEKPESWMVLAGQHLEFEMQAEAEACARKAVEIAPDDPRAVGMLGVIASFRGDALGSLEAFDRAVGLKGATAENHSHRLFAQSYVDDSARYLAFAGAFGEVASAGARPFTDWPVLAGPAEPLRIGLVSGDLRSHPVGFFIESVLPHLRNEGLEVIAFPTSAYDDQVTRRLKAACTGWIPIAGSSDAAAAARIRDERIHVLLDLAGHSAYNRLPTFAWRPAPVQASWLGYWASTGVREMDFIVADPQSVPPGQEALYTEQVWRLPTTRLCFTAPAVSPAPDVGPLPALASGRVTFGSYQNLNKVGDAVIDAWRRVLDAVPGSVLRLQAKQTALATQDRVRERLVARGIDPGRLVMVPPTGRAQYLASYAEVDLLLDSFPFPGGTTTCEALWMGVPTVTIGGATMVANQGRLIMGTAGLADWIAQDVDDYVALAVAKAGDLDSLAALRARLRAQVLASPLFDAPRFSRDLAAALRGMWAARTAG